MRRKNWIYAITSIVLIYCTAIPLFAQVAEEEGEKRRKRIHIPRSEYTEAYKETYSPENYAGRYREDYRFNPIYTSSSDRSRLRHGGHLDGDYDDYHEDRLKTPLKPNFYEHGTRRLSVPQLQTSSSYTGPLIDYRQILRPAPLPPGVYQLLREREEAEDQQKEPSESTDENRESQSNLAQPPKLRSPSTLAYETGIESLHRYQSRKAVKIFENLTQSNPKNSRYQSALGVAYFFNGRYEEALPIFQKHPMQFAYGGLQNTFPQYSYHKRKLQRYVEQNPNDESAKKLLQRLP